MVTFKPKFSVISIIGEVLRQYMTHDIEVSPEKDRVGMCYLYLEIGDYQYGFSSDGEIIQKVNLKKLKETKEHLDAIKETPK